MDEFDDTTPPAPRRWRRREFLQLSGLTTVGVALGGGTASAQTDPSVAAGELPGVSYATVRAQNLNIRVGQAGPTGGRAILLVHGGLVDHQWWIRQVAPLVAQGFRVVLPDMPGHGGSPNAPLWSYAYGFDSRVIADIITALGLVKPLIVGWSLGAARVAVGLGSGGVLEPLAGGVVFTSALIRDIGGNTPPGALLPIGAAAVGWASPFVRRCAAPQTLDPVDEERFTRGAERTDAETIGRLSAAAAVTDATDRIAASAVPIRVVQGGRDQVVRPQAGVDLAAAVGVELDAFPEAGHAPFYVEPDRFNALLASFAAGLG
jgi:pimeloyl-ACP methyl ester carboxylesterase